MKYLAIFLMALAMITAGCGEGGGAGGGSASPSITAAAKTAGDPVYTFEISGDVNVEFAATFSLNNVNLSQHSETDTGNVLLTDTNTKVYTVNGQDIIANVTLISGAGTLNIIFKRNGVPVESHSITSNGTNITMSDGV